MEKNIIVLGIIWSILAANGALAIIIRADNKNYKALIANSTHTNIAIFCARSDDNTNYDQFLSIWNDFSLQSASHLIFAVCDTKESSDFVRTINPDKLPAIFMMNMGVVYHYYLDKTNLANRSFIREYLKYYSKMSHKKTILPQSLLENKDSHKIPQTMPPPSSQTEDEEEDKKKINEEPAPRMSLLEIVYAKASALIITPENQTLDQKRVVKMGVCIMAAPIISGLAFMLVGYVISKFSESADATKDNKKDKSKKD